MFYVKILNINIQENKIVINESNESTNENDIS